MAEEGRWIRLNRRRTQAVGARRGNHSVGSVGPLEAGTQLGGQL